MIVYRVQQEDGLNYPWGFCAKCGKSAGRFSIPDWNFCPWCGHKFGKRIRKQISYSEMMKLVGRDQEG